MMTRRLTHALALVVAGAIFPASAAAGPRLVLDAFSFSFFEGDNATAVLPSGAEIPLELMQASATSWTVTIPQGALDVPPVRYPSGRSVRWTLSGPALGQLTLTDQGGSCRIEAPLVAHVEGGDSSVPFPLTFSTETASSQGDGLVASRTGVRLDSASGFIQLVAAGVSPEGAPTAPGKPFYAVLSGQILDLPQELKTP
jgi:hypothetical protein